MKKYLIVALFCSPSVFAKTLQDCGMVKIEQIITGPRHGALLNIDNNSCGNSGYVCLDINGEYASKFIAQAAYSFALANKMANKKVNITVDKAFNPKACNGAYPVIEDIRN